MQLKAIKNTGKTIVYLIGLSALILGTVYVLDHGLTTGNALVLMLGGIIGYFWWQEDQQKERMKIGSRSFAHNCSYSESTSKYPVPNRSKFIPNQYCNDSQLREGDLGAKSGMLENQRPYRLELWWQDGMTAITLFFSVIDIESLSPRSLLKLVRPVLEQEYIPKEHQILTQENITIITDAEGNDMYSISFIVGFND